MPARVEVLGPLRLIVDGAEVAVPGPKRRALLALLAVAEERTLSVDELLDALWPRDLPDTARATLQSHISRLRRHLGPHAGRLESGSAGYRLALGADGTDVDRARRNLGEARDAHPSEAVRLLEEARRLWRGAPLSEFPDVLPLAAAAVTLGELRRAVDTTLVEALLAAGDAERAALVAGEQAAAAPLSEPAVLLFMRCLHRLGRSADGLRAAYAYRRRLREETGLDPTGALAALESELATAARRSTDAVPRPSLPLRGRESELASLRRLLTTGPVVTVVGAGGVGKTRLALEAASGVEPATAVFLASVADERSLPPAIAESLGLRVLHGDVLSACAAFLAAGQRLLLLDNCEHLLRAVRDIVGRFVEQCPELTVLVTSREPLGLPAEQRLRLPPLSVSRPAGPADISRSPAVAVFVDRASRVRNDLVFGPADLALVGEIVRRLDGVPLAIELAAARLSSLGLRDLDARLDRALDLLGEDPGRTLRHTISWSYDLLPAHEQRLLRFSSVFPDGLDLATVETLAADVAADGAALRAIGHLVDASMVQVSHEPATRYRMLDTVRAFAAEKLAEHGESPQATEFFLRWEVSLAGWIATATSTPDEPHGDAVLRRELPNLRAAWSLLRALGRAGQAVELMYGLIDAAGWRDLPEVWDWSLELAADPSVAATAAGPAVLGMAASSAWSRGDLERADALARAGLDLAGVAEWFCTDARSLVALSRGDFRAAVEHATAAAELARRPGQSLGIAALASAYGGDLGAARAFNDRFAQVARSPTLRSFHAYVDGEIAALAGDREGAIARYDEAIELASSSGCTFVQGIASVGRLSQYARRGDTDEALAGFSDLIDYWERTGSWVQQWTTLRNLADVLEAVGDRDAARFLRDTAAVAADAPRVPGTASSPAPSQVLVPRDRVLEVARSAIGHALA